ncbi:HAMP domain-containing sensor histidine kinase [soil metagenome]
MTLPALRLRTRVTLFFALIALVAGVGLTVVTYAFARNYLLDERTSSARQQAFTNATSVREVLRRDADISDFFATGLRLERDGFALLSNGSVATDLALQLDDLPPELQTAVANHQSGTQQFSAGGDPYVAVAQYLPEADTAYIEAFPLDPADRTLRAIVTALTIGTVVTTMLATFFGWSTSRRLLRPISRVADAAGEIASGGLDTRLEPENDPDLDRLAGSFNEMADAVQARIEREARFASDVSHELRSPITALAAAVEVLHARRHELPERTQQALDVIVSQVRRFDDMVIDLLELSRLDAGATELNLEQTDIVDLTHRIAARMGFADVPIEVTQGIVRQVTIDKVRYERILTNLLENGMNHGGGPTRITIGRGRLRGSVSLAVEDAGPGVAHSERRRIFERFARGSAARHRVGTGLGLALVAEHASALGGEAWVEDRPGGGARFVVEIKVAQR